MNRLPLILTPGPRTKRAAYAYVIAELVVLWIAIFNAHEIEARVQPLAERERAALNRAEPALSGAVAKAEIIACHVAPALCPWHPKEKRNG